MQNGSSRWLESRKRSTGQEAGQSLASWLNDPHLNPAFVHANAKPIEDLIMDAQAVFRWLGGYGSSAHVKRKNVPSEVWNSYVKLNETLATFTHTPYVDLEDFPDGEPLTWLLVTEKPPLALLRVQVKMVLQLIQQGAILKLRRCRQCGAWFFARFLNQQFCKYACRRENFEGTEKYKEQRRKYMRQRYQDEIARAKKHAEASKIRKKKLK